MIGAAGSDFERAFVAMCYFGGTRGDALLEPLGDASPAAERLVRRLSHEDRRERALALADELARIARALDARGFK